MKAGSDSGFFHIFKKPFESHPVTYLYAEKTVSVCILDHSGDSSRSGAVCKGI